MKAFQLVPFIMRSPTFAVGTTDVVTLDVLPETGLGRIAHLAGIQIRHKVTPTLTTAPTIQGINNICNRLEFNDGQQPRFQGGYNILRYFELLENGCLRLPDPDTNSGSGNPFFFSRYLSMGPWGFEGDPTDFLIPCAALKTGKLEFKWGALTDFSADTTALTVTTELIAWLAFLDGEVRIPPFYERNTFQVSNADAQLPGRALYVCGGLLNDSAFGAITAGDFSSIIVGTGSGDLPGVTVQGLRDGFLAQMGSGHLNQVNGEPGAATDDNSKIVNGGTPTAFTAADNTMQPWAWSPEGMRISKLALMAESSLRVRWPTGSQATGVLLYGRFASMSPNAQAALGARALNNLGMRSQSGGVATLSKLPYRGPRDEFMPHYMKVA